MIPIYQVDAFTTDAFKGNPAGVCLLTEEPSASWMQAIAAEMNVSETVFVRNALPVVRSRGEPSEKKWNIALRPTAISICWHSGITS